MAEYEIEDGVPFPDRPRRQRYPLLELKVGQSFGAPAHVGGGIYSAASWAGARHNMKFTVCRQKDGTYRVWRVA